MKLGERLDRLPQAVELAALPLALLVVWLGSSIPSNSLPNLQIFSQDKLIHFMEYTGLGLAFWISGRRHWLRLLRSRCTTGFCVLTLGLVLPGALWAASDEFHQLFVGRDCSIWDWLADLCGLVLASWLVRKSV